MTPEPAWTDSHRAAQDKVRQALVSDPGLTSAELAVGSGVILSVRGAVSDWSSRHRTGARRP